MGFIRYILIGFTLGLLAHATTVVPPSFEQLVGRSEAIFRGRVTAVTAGWSGEGGARRIATRVTFAVERALRGTVGDSLTLEFIGGQIGDRRLVVAGTPQFVVGERGVFFVENRTARLCPLLRFGHGRYRITTGEADGIERIARDDRSPLAAVEAVREPLAEADATVRSAQVAGGMTVADFEQAILERAAGQPGAQAKEAK